MTVLADMLPKRDVPPELQAKLDGLAPTILTRADLGQIADAATLLDQARNQAERWTEGARARFRRAHEEGHQEGRDAATEILMRERIDLAARIEALRAEQAQQLETLLADALRRFYGAASWDALIVAAVSEALAQASGAPATVLAATPNDLAALAGHGADWPLERIEDATLGAGEVELRGEGGVICISLDRHRDQLLRALTAPGGADDG